MAKKIEGIHSVSNLMCPFIISKDPDWFSFKYKVFFTQSLSKTTLVDGLMNFRGDYKS
jgi:hypothetical protein